MVYGKVGDGGDGLGAGERLFARRSSSSSDGEERTATVPVTISGNRLLLMAAGKGATSLAGTIRDACAYAKLEVTNNSFGILCARVVTPRIDLVCIEVDWREMKGTESKIN